MEKKATCQVSFDGWDWKNVFTVKSPTGKTAKIHCNGKWSSMGQELKDLIHKYEYTRKGGPNYKWGKFYEEELTYSMMKEIKTLANS